jgi:hypothetical protein
MDNLLRTNSETIKNIDKNISQDEGVSKISSVDAVIINSLKYLTEKSFPMLGDILESYKNGDTDQDICDKLQDLVEVVEKSSEKGDGDESSKMIRVGDEYIFAQYIKSIGFSDGFDEQDIDFPIRYNIIINKGSNEKIVYSNLEIEFFSPTQRELAFKKLKSQMQQFSDIMFIE